ncbi:MAG: hypothetical protein KDA84_08710 [Planctomycetaceae bacterium]|nr:hypothetical protein [Planctomycetaceae bacterium]
MGVDWLDIQFRLERRFDIKLNRMDLERLWDEERQDLTAGDLLSLVSDTLQTQNRKVSFSAWTRVRLEVAIALGVSPQKIHRESWLIADLGME